MHSLVARGSVASVHRATMKRETTTTESPMGPATTHSRYFTMAHVRQLSRIATFTLLAITALLMVLPLLESEVQYGFVRDTSVSGSDFDELTDTHNRTTHYFTSHGVRLEAWLYLPLRPKDGQGTTPASADGSTEPDAPQSAVPEADLPDAPACTTHDSSSAGGHQNEGGSGHKGSDSSKNKGGGWRLPLIGRLKDKLCQRRRPPAPAPPPVLVMAHGLGVQRDHKLPQFAAQFAAHGYAVWLFDYRTWGGSDGEPRQLVSGPMFAEDYVSAVDHLVGSGGLGGLVDPGRLVLWGTSYSGGHCVVAAAARPEQVAAVVAMEPFLGMRHTGHARRLPSMEEADNGLRIFGVALHDAVRARLGLQRAYLRLLAPRGSGVLALGHMAWGDYETLMDSRPEVMLGGWQNRVVASSVFEHARYHPIRHISKVKAPLLFIAGLQDELTPAYLIVKGLQQASASARTSFTAKPGATHVSLYQHPDVVPDMLAFLQLLGLASEEELAAGAARQSAAVMDKVLVEEPVP